MNPNLSPPSSLPLLKASTTDQGPLPAIDTPTRIGSIDIVQTLSFLENEINHLYEHVPFGSHISDANDTYLQINSLELSWLGCTREEIIGKKKLTDFMTPDSREKFRRHFPFVVKSKFVIDLEFDLVGKNGTIRPVSLCSTDFVDPDGHRLKHRSVLFDMTERNLNEEKQRIAAIAFESLSGTIITDCNGKIEQVNRAFTTLTGYSTQDVLGRSPRFLSSGCKNRATYHAMRTSLKENKNWQGEFCIRRKDGKHCTEWLSASAVASADGSVVRSPIISAAFSTSRRVMRRTRR